MATLLWVQCCLAYQVRFTPGSLPSFLVAPVTSATPEQESGEADAACCMGWDPDSWRLAYWLAEHAGLEAVGGTCHRFGLQVSLQVTSLAKPFTQNVSALCPRRKLHQPKPSPVIVRAGAEGVLT